MPLLDHFHPPLLGRHHWESFHAVWAGELMAALNRRLPPDYFAETQCHDGRRIEVDVGAWHDPLSGWSAGDGGGGVATLPAVRAEPAITEPALAPADLVLGATFPPECTVEVYETSGGPRLVAAVELVSPGNKDRDETRRAFAAKCAAYLNRGVGLIVIDTVTSRPSQPLLDLLALAYPDVPPPAAAAPLAAPLAAASYRPARAAGGDAIEVRVRPLAVGGPLPTLPLSLGVRGVVEVDFEAAYEEARGRSRLSVSPAA